MAFNQSLQLVGPSASSAPGAAGSANETISIPATGLYEIAWDASFPIPRDGFAASGLIVRVRNNTQAVNIYLGSAGVSSMGGQVWFSANANDVISLNLSSTTAADLTALNIIKVQFECSSGV